MRLPGHRETRSTSAASSARGKIAGLCLVVFVGVVLSTQPGCLGLISNLMHVTGADKTPAAFEGLEDSRVAVVTLTENSQYGDDVAARVLGRNVSQWLSKEVDGIKLIREDKIANWRDTHGWDQVEFEEIGRGVDADKVLAIEVSNLKLRDGATLYRGHADVLVSVIDAKTGDSLYSSELEDFTYPTTAGVYTNETTEDRFRKLYLGILAKRISRQFYPYDPRDDFAMDSIIAR